MNFDVKALLANPPALHEDKGELVSYWRIDDTTCIELDKRLRRGMKTLETGAGLSTIIFAAHGCEHTCITPGQRETERILTYCRSVGIDTSKVRFIVSRSSDVIHQTSPSEYDLILVDGCHGFPSVFVDFYYAVRALKLGGTIVIDDLHISTCNYIARFMQSDPGWNLDLMTGRVAFANRISDTLDTEWVDQPFVADGDHRPERLGMIGAMVKSLRSHGPRVTAHKILGRVLGQQGA